jgi:hypothetical protein
VNLKEICVPYWFMNFAIKKINKREKGDRTHSKQSKCPSKAALSHVVESHSQPFS